MKRILLYLVLFLVLCPAIGNANPVTLHEAARVAASFWQGRYGTSVTMVEAASSAAYDGLYVFNVANVGGSSSPMPSEKIPVAGFVIVAADDCAMPIIAYSDQTEADEAVPTSVDAWLHYYSDAVLYCAAHDIEATEQIASQWARLRENAPLDDPEVPRNTVAALLTTTWNQRPLYNAMCPYDSSAQERTVTGCVATAMAQVMRYWRRPAVGVSSKSYTHATYGRLSANFSSTHYAWSQMPDALTSSSTQTQIDAVATLMYHCGVAVSMIYGVAANGGSAAQTIAYNNSRAICAENALKSFFDYKTTLHGYERSGYSDATWTSMLRAELDAGRPVMYTGRDPAGGHSFVCDGYDSHDYFHFNWGWGGSYDGYYALNALNPGAGGVGGNATYTFNSSQTMLIGIEPNNRCLAPSNPALLSSTNTAAIVGWTAGGSESQWVLHTCCGGSHRYDTVSTNPAVLTGLLSGASYSVAVAALCSADEASGWSDTLAFSTMMCDAPTPTSALADGNTVTLAWTSPASVSLWEVEYGPQGFGHGDGTIITVTSPTATITGLEGNTAYDFYVRALCHDDAFSDWSHVVAATTGEALLQHDTAEVILSIHPNPATQQQGAVIAIANHGEAQQIEITVVDMVGRPVWRQSILCQGSCTELLPLSGLQAGTYFVRLATATASATRKLVVR